VSSSRDEKSKYSRQFSVSARHKGEEGNVVNPGAREWRTALQKAGILAGASVPSIMAAVQSLGLDWWFREATGHDLLRNSGKIIAVKI
jgi:hypothetical protein